MKKFLVIVIAFIVTAEAVSAQQLELKEVIARSARGIEDEMPQRRAKVALLNFESSSKEFSDYVLDELTSELLEAGKVTVVDRRNITAILNEMKFQYSGYVSDESMVSIGKMIGAQYIISGTLTDMKTYYRFRIRVINVETAAIQRQITSELKKDAEVAYLMGGDSAVREIEMQEKMRPTSNVRNNWLSAEVSGGFNLWQGPGLSLGARYERMLGPYVSLGVDFYKFIPFDKTYNKNITRDRGSSFSDEITPFDIGNIFGIDASFRFYPWGRKFFMGLALGYHDGGNMISDSNDIGLTINYNRIISWVTAHAYGLAVTGEFGWKIDVGKEGGFFVQPGFLGSFLVGKMDNHDLTNWHTERDHFSDEFYSGYWRFYLGAGWAF